jgi:hypothetical protein
VLTVKKEEEEKPPVNMPRHLDTSISRRQRFDYGNVTFPGQGTGFCTANSKSSARFWKLEAYKSDRAKAFIVTWFMPDAFNPETYLANFWGKPVIVNGLDPWEKQQRNKVFQAVWAFRESSQAVEAISKVLGAYFVNAPCMSDGETVEISDSEPTDGRPIWEANFMHPAKYNKKQLVNMEREDSSTQKQVLDEEKVSNEKKEPKERSARHEDGSVEGMPCATPIQAKVLACPVWLSSPQDQNSFSEESSLEHSEIADIFVITVTALIRDGQLKYDNRWESYVHTCVNRELAISAWINAIRMHGDNFFNPAGEIQRPHGTNKSIWPPTGRLDLYWEGKTVDYEAIFVCATSLCFETSFLSAGGVMQRAIDVKQYNRCGHIGVHPCDNNDLGDFGKAYREQNEGLWRNFKIGPSITRDDWDERDREEKRVQRNAARRERRQTHTLVEKDSRPPSAAPVLRGAKRARSKPTKKSPEPAMDNSSSDSSLTSLSDTPTEPDWSDDEDSGSLPRDERSGETTEEDTDDMPGLVRFSALGTHVLGSSYKTTAKALTEPQPSANNDCSLTNSEPTMETSAQHCDSNTKLDEKDTTGQTAANRSRQKLRDLLDRALSGENLPRKSPKKSKRTVQKQGSPTPRAASNRGGTFKRIQITGAARRRSKAALNPELEKYSKGI